MGTSALRSGNNAPRGGTWTRAKRLTTSFVRGTGATAASAVGGFVSAVGNGGDGISGGSAGHQSSSSVKAGQALGAFLGNVATVGLDQALRSSGLEHLIGAVPYEVLSGVVDYICGNGGPLDDAIARSAVIEVLAEIFDDSDEKYTYLRDNWDSQVDENHILDLMSLFLSQAIFQRFIMDLGDRFETNAISATEAEQKEQEAFEFIREMVEFELGEIDPLNFDWQGPDGERLIQRNLAAALDQLET